MRDINGMILKVGDSITTIQGVCVIEAMIAPDNGTQGEMVRVKNIKGKRTDIRLRLSKAEYLSPTPPTGFKLGDYVSSKPTAKLGDMLAHNMRKGA